MEEEVLEKQNLHIEDFKLSRRRDLLPVWIKIFVWMFIVFGAFIPVAIIMCFLGMNFKLSLYGMETIYPISILGFSIMLLFLIKGVVALGLWTEKEWAINLAILDAIIGIIICVFIMFVLPYINHKEGTNLRLELVPLVMYLVMMIKIRSEWSVRIELNIQA